MFYSQWYLNMAYNIFNRFYLGAFRSFNQLINAILDRSFPPGYLYAIECNVVNQAQHPVQFPGQSIRDILNETILWAVPKKRRSLERRLNRRYGIPELHWKPHVPKTNILMCRKCGHDYEAGTLCGYCYEIVKKETKEMQIAIQKSLGLQPVEQDVIVLYEGEKEKLKNDDFWKKQRIIELPKKRPDWFHTNLLQPTAEELPDSEQTLEPESSKDVKNK